MMRRALMLATLAFGLTTLLASQLLADDRQLPPVRVYKAPGWVCCGGWSKHLEDVGFNPFGTSCGKRGLYFLICLQQKEFHVDSLSTMQLKATGSRKQYREAPCNGPAPVHRSH